MLYFFKIIEWKQFTGSESSQSNEQERMTTNCRDGITHQWLMTMRQTNRMSSALNELQIVQLLLEHECIANGSMILKKY